MAYPHSHKTVIVLDHGPSMLKSSKQVVEYDMVSKSRSQGVIPLAPISKTLWTCNVEAAVEYARIVYDIFPRNKMIRIITSDNTSKSLNSWDQPEQNLQCLMTALAQYGAPVKKAGEEYTVMHGLSLAVEVLCEPSSVQHAARTSMTESAAEVINQGRIICLTHSKSQSHLKSLQDCVQETIIEHNKLATSTDNLIPINQCALDIVNVVPVGNDSPITNEPCKELSPHLLGEIVVTQSGRNVASTMVDLAMKHYDLASTTVTGIPMKEEQNASSSANYDVELLHPALAHMELVKSGAVEGLITASKEGLFADTVTLKWCTPKSNAVELQQCRGAYRMTPVDVNSRPSSCLTNFLLNGRAVMLEQPRKSGTKVISHMLSSHGGEIYIHCLATTRSMLEDPPSISEGAGGRVTDYRINDFGELMKDCRLAPVAELGQGKRKPIHRAMSYVERMTRLWPMTISDTIIFNMLSTIDPLPGLLVKETLNDDDLLECKKCIYHIVDMESRNEALPVPAAGTRGKGPKRDEQYRQMWAELEKLVRAHSDTSDNHEKVLGCLLECKKPSEDSRASPQKGQVEKVKEEKEDPQLAMKEHDRYMRMTEREKQELNRTDYKPDPSKLGDPPLKKFKMNQGNKSGGPQSVLAMWSNRIQSIHNSRHAEFSGRVESKGSSQAELYTFMNEEIEEMDTTPGPSHGNGKPPLKTGLPSALKTTGSNGKGMGTIGRASPNLTAGKQYKPSSSLKKPS